jgi:hypothetical protein
MIIPILLLLSLTIVTSLTCEKAARLGTLKYVKQAHKQGQPLGKTLEYSARFGYPDILKYAHENGGDILEPHILKEACKSGNLECVKYIEHVTKQAHGLFKYSLMYQDFSCYIDTAIHYGHLNIVKYLHKNKYRWNKNYTASQAVIKDNLEILKFLHENGCNWDYDTTRIAVLFNSIECLKYAVENGCPIDMRNARFQAEMHGYTECYEYLCSKYKR